MNLGSRQLKKIMNKMILKQGRYVCTECLRKVDEGCAVLTPLTFCQLHNFDHIS